MPFKILNKKDATVDELASAYAEIESRETDLEGQKQAAYADMVSSQQEAMGSKKGAAAKLDKAKAAHQEIELQVEACRDAMNKIRERIQAVLPDHFRQQIAALKKQHSEVSRKRDKIREEWLTVCAQAAVINEQICGSGVIHLGSGDMKQTTPEPGFSYAALAHDNQLFYLEKVREFRSKVDPGESLNTQLNRISSEIDKLEKIIEQGDFAAEAEKVLDGYRPKSSESKPEPEGGAQVIAAT
ncbi:MAG: hypothetical protein ACOCQI_06740 [Desulfosalsimonas sp.]